MGCLNLTYREHESPLRVIYRKGKLKGKSVQRCLSTDPLAADYVAWSTYNYVMGNPVFYTDPTGMGVETTIVTENEDGTYKVKDWIDDGKTDVVLEDGTKVGESLTTHSFVNAKNIPVVGAVIDPNSSDGQIFIDNEIIKDNPNVFNYKDNATLNEHFDFKSRGLSKDATPEKALIYRSRGSMTSDGKMASARDFGNMAAGIVATRAGVPEWYAKKKFNDLQGGEEPPVSAKAQQIGLNKGKQLKAIDNYNKIVRDSKGPIKGSKF